MERATEELRASFDDFASSVGEQVRRGLVAFYGVEIGSEATAEAMTLAWERWAEVEQMDNPGGFLFRVGQSRARPHVRWARRRGAFPSGERSSPDTDPSVFDLLAALGRLSAAQRTAVLLTKSHGFSYREVADLLNVTEAAVTNHVHRGLANLRSLMGMEYPSA
jgi:RNA polymerase sigma-70 factor (ECF subfamily)